MGRTASFCTVRIVIGRNSLSSIKQVSDKEIVNGDVAPSAGPLKEETKVPKNKPLHFSLIPKVRESKTRGHRFKVRGERYKRLQRNICFTQKVVSVWDELPEAVVEVGTILSFKKHLDSYMG